MDDQRISELRTDLAGAAIDAQVTNYDRVVELTVADVGRLYVRTGGGQLRIDGAAPSDVDTMLRVGISASAARGVGTGTALIEDEFANGSITLDGVQPDDYRQAPVLERLLEGMASVGMFEGVPA